MDEILNCSHSNESSCTIISCDAVYYAVQAGADVRVYAWMRDLTVTIQIKAFEQYVSTALFF